MSVSELLGVLRARWRVILVVVGVVIALTAGLSVVQTPLYSSSTQLFVSTSTDDDAQIYQGSLYSVQRVQSYQQLALSREIASSVVDELKLDMSPSEVQSKVSASVLPQTTVLQVTVSDPDPHKAQQIGRAYASVLVDAIDDLETPEGSTKSLVKANIIDGASLPTSPYSPNWLIRMLLALFIGLILGVALGIVRHLMDNKVRDARMAAELIQVPLLSVVGKFDQRRPTTEQFGLQEAIRLLRTNLIFADAGRSSRVYVVASPAPGDGKTMIACELARTLALSGMRVLLVDADLRRPMVAKRTDLDPAAGLTSVMIGSISLRDAVQRFDDWDIDVLTSGRIPPNPSELLGAAIKPVLTAARAEYDVVVIDAAPLLPVSDTSVLSTQADGVILVARHGATTRRQLILAQGRLTAVSAKVLGLVLNLAPASATTEYGYGYGYGYGAEGSASPLKRERAAGHGTHVSGHEATDEGVVGSGHRGH